MIPTGIPCRRPNRYTTPPASAPSANTAHSIRTNRSEGPPPAAAPPTSRTACNGGYRVIRGSPTHPSKRYPLPRAMDSAPEAYTAASPLSARPGTT